MKSRRYQPIEPAWLVAEKSPAFHELGTDVTDQPAVVSDGT